MGDAIERIVAAIDQLTRDAQGESAGPEHAADMSVRLAGIWLMLTALDPEIARRERRYTESDAPADGEPRS